MTTKTFASARVLGRDVPPPMSRANAAGVSAVGAARRDGTTRGERTRRGSAAATGERPG